MADDDTNLNTYDTDSDSESRIEPRILYPIIGGVFMMFCVLSIAAFVTSNKKCCKTKKQDPESILLKQHLLEEQKRLSKAHFTLPLSDHPSFTSIMQQEENDIAEEVKESYKSISLDISKPIICCPHHKMSYMYDPKEKIDQSSFNNKDVRPCIEHCREDIAKQPRCFEEIYQNADKILPEQKNSPLHQKEGVKTRFYIAPSEIERADDVKALYFEKWLKQTEENEIGEIKSESDFRFERLELSYDDVESILTSISRMDSHRLQRLKDTKFYRNLMNNIDIPHEECVEDDTSIESIDVQEIDIVANEKSGKTGQSYHQSNFTHDEIMSVFIDNKDEYQIFQDIDNRVKNITNDEINPDTFNDEQLIESKRSVIDKSFIPISESLFKVVKKSPPFSHETSYTETVTNLENQFKNGPQKYSENSSMSSSSEITKNSIKTRPTSLDLIIKNSDLSLESSDSAASHSTMKKSVCQKNLSKDSYTGSSFTKSSYTTSWHKICDEKRKRKYQKNILKGKDENLNVIARSHGRSKSKSDLRSVRSVTTYHSSNFTDNKNIKEKLKIFQDLRRFWIDQKLNI